VFGPIPPLRPASLEPLPASYIPLATSIAATTAKVESTLREWDALADANRAAYGQELRTVQNAAAHLPGPIRPLAQFLMARRRAWTRAKASAPYVIDFIPRLADHARAALQLDLAVEDFCVTEDEVATVGDTERDELAAQHRRLLKGTVQLCWTFKELRAFEALSTKWANTIPPAVFSDDDTLMLNGRSLHDAVRPLAEWAKAARELDEYSRQDRKTMWRATNRPFDTRHNRSLWFWFGSPHPEEIPNGLEGMHY
jgi:phosphoglycolate phosphatase-like HAD superfamily hydrolase